MHVSSTKDVWQARAVSPSLQGQQSVSGAGLKAAEIRLLCRPVVRHTALAA